MEKWKTANFHAITKKKNIFAVENYVEKLLTMLKDFTQVKRISYNDVEKYVETVESVENSIRGSSADDRKVASCSSHGAPRLTHDLQGKIFLTFFQKTLTFSIKYDRI